MFRQNFFASHNVNFTLMMTLIETLIFNHRCHRLKGFFFFEHGNHGTNEKTMFKKNLSVTFVFSVVKKKNSASPRLRVLKTKSRNEKMRQ